MYMYISVIFFIFKFYFNVNFFWMDRNIYCKYIMYFNFHFFSWGNPFKD